MMYIVFIVLTSILSGVCFAGQKSYSGYKLLETEILEEDGVAVLSLYVNDWDFWQEPCPGQRTQLLVHVEDLEHISHILDTSSISYSVIVDDVQRFLEESSVPQDTPEQPSSSITFTKFHRLAEIYRYMDELAVRYPDLASIQRIGTSYEGRDLKLIKISSGHNTSKPAVFIDAGIHSREWIAPPVAIYTMYQLVENYTAHSHLVDNIDWYILPILNPDGYEFTHTTDRFWRKTRSNHGNSSCLGVDANRNFDFHWSENGSSCNPCSWFFYGPKPLSEPETAAVAAFLWSNRNNIRLYLSLHSFAQSILLPWGYTADPVEDAGDMESLGLGAAAALKAVRGTKYRVGSSVSLLGYASGNSQDWAKGVAGIKYSYTMELTPGGLVGFNPPPSDILPVAEESFEAIRVFATAVGNI